MTTARAVLDAACTERQFQEAVIAYATAQRWVHYHVFDSRRSPAGFPDLVLCRLSRLVFAELKAANGRVSREQAAWLDRLLATGKAEVYLWRPGDWDTIEATLR